MASAPLSKVTVKNADELCARFELQEQSRPLLKPGISPAQYLDVLIEKQQFPDAVKFLAHGLPRREAVWWACLCAKTAAGTAVSAPVSAAIKSVERWVTDPSEENRRATMPAAEQATFGTPAGCAALAAFFSGGSLGPENVAAVPPAEKLTADAVAGSIMLAVVGKEPEKAIEKYRAFLTRGIEVANGKSTWK